MNLMLDVVLRKLPCKTSFFRQRLNSYAAASTSSRMASGWTGLDSRRLLYAEIRANDMDQQIDNYTKHFGMQLLKRSQDTDQHSAYMGYGPLDSNFAIKTVAPGSDAMPIDIGTGFIRSSLMAEQ
ncbi:hypothetical protein CEUSTIGMA_g2799.t1 [Chlamydomonas eustigma]|uniref:Glyoxalase/fosfomycin resistance/dioxygenase domain-containing protein n=1 Tax=Chlamydomonas eustigma TaxID=1157962 RepID=A0A250WX41_9CHLO|nr:hypothetical protein CEUSTIGMA_g2799.t1 [Chlamydomonas eustigma]|eukprot:GAX75355.1 hypothetical protein CEUSTIGMA_g2799.t1 [Chlamydomonas eustigma]